MPLRVCAFFPVHLRAALRTWMCVLALEAYSLLSFPLLPPALRKSPCTQHLFAFHALKQFLSSVCGLHLPILLQRQAISACPLRVPTFDKSLPAPYWHWLPAYFTRWIAAALASKPALFLQILGLLFGLQRMHVVATEAVFAAPYRATLCASLAAWSRACWVTAVYAPYVAVVLEVGQRCISECVARLRPADVARKLLIRKLF